MKNFVLSLLTVTILVTGCKDKKSSKGKNTETANVETQKEPKTVSKKEEAVCVYEGLSIRDTPSKKGKWLTRVSLGEKMTYLGEDVIDSLSKKSYSKIKLTDGKEGWIQTRFIVVNGTVGVLIEESPMYRRPDLLTKTDKKYSPMDIIAIEKTQDEWLQVKGKRSEGEYVETGWIKSSNISNSDVDIATAKFALVAMNNKNSMSERIDELQKVIDNPDFSSSKFIPLIEEKIKNLKEKNQFKDTFEKPTEN